MNGIRGFKTRPRKREHWWSRVPDSVWEVIGELLIKVAGGTLKSKVAKIIIVSLIAAATKVDVSELEDIFEEK